MAAGNGVDIDGIGEFSLERVHPNEARGACVYRKLDPDVLMMKSAENGM
jgi:hypothetical protein